MNTGTVSIVSSEAPAQTSGNTLLERSRFREGGR